MVKSLCDEICWYRILETVTSVLIKTTELSWTDCPFLSCFSYFFLYLVLLFLNNVPVCISQHTHFNHLWISIMDDGNLLLYPHPISSSPSLIFFITSVINQFFIYLIIPKSSVCSTNKWCSVITFFLLYFVFLWINYLVILIRWILILVWCIVYKKSKFMDSSIFTFFLFLFKII